MPELEAEIDRDPAMNEPDNRVRHPCRYSRSFENGEDELCCPAAIQSGEEVSVWLRDHGQLNEAVVVFFSQHGLCQFRLYEIKARRTHRVYLVEHGAFDVQGFALDEPRGVCLRILIPLPPVV
jgi:hypothetical protein